ncbi:MAG: ABC transporter substrate-binding protein, partial [Chloroflexi bacterium]|nr:ABC transporter substrate-binding protein [Chloroflexota bacterium]
MRRRLVKGIGLVVLVAVLVALPVLTGCGGGGTTSKVNKIKFGWDWDFGGRASFGVVSLWNGIEDYLRMARETGQMPEGLDVQLINYDNRSDSGRVLPGYVWLKGQGMQLLTAAPQDSESLLPSCVKDNIPIYNSSTSTALLANSMVVAEYGSPESQLEVIMKWIQDTDWTNYATRKPKIGVITLAGVSFYATQQALVEQWAVDHSDKFDIVPSQVAPTTTTAWVSEILKLKDCDYIVTCLSGSPLAGFVKEA